MVSLQEFFRSFIHAVVVRLVETTFNLRILFRGHIINCNTLESPEANKSVGAAFKLPMSQSCHLSP